MRNWNKDFELEKYNEGCCHKILINGKMLGQFVKTDVFWHVSCGLSTEWGLFLDNLYTATDYRVRLPDLVKTRDPEDLNDMCIGLTYFFGTSRLHRGGILGVSSQRARKIHKFFKSRSSVLVSVWKS